MIKKFLIFSFIFLISFANSAFAHTHLESSSPQSGEVLTGQLNAITLTFEGKIEQSSSFTLQKVDGEAIPVDNIAVSENVLTGSLSTLLENGEYLISWNIIGADGHVMDGDVPFTVDMPVPEANGDMENNPAVEEVTDAELIMDTDETDKAAEEEQTNNETTEDTPAYLVPSLIGVLLLIVIGSFLFIAKRKQ